MLVTRARRDGVRPAQGGKCTRVVGHRKLNLGCGSKHLADAVNLDASARCHPDVVHDLNCRPWPFPDNNFEEVLAYDVLEHLADLPETMEEIYRLSRAKAIVRVTTPHYSCANAFADPTHRHQLGLKSFDYFLDDHPLAYYSNARFALRSRQLIFYPTLVNKIVCRLANAWPDAYERRWAWMFPAWFMSFELEVVK